MGLGHLYAGRQQETRIRHQQRRLRQRRRGPHHHQDRRLRERIVEDEGHGRRVPAARLHERLPADLTGSSGVTGPGRASRGPGPGLWSFSVHETEGCDGPGRRPVRRPPRTRSPPLPGAGSRAGAADREPPPGSPASSGKPRRSPLTSRSASVTTGRAGMASWQGNGLAGAENGIFRPIRSYRGPRCQVTRRHAAAAALLPGPSGRTVSASESDHNPAPPSPVPMNMRPRQLPEAVQACARHDGRVGQLGYHDIRARLARNLGGEPNRVVACCYLLSEGILRGGHR